MTKRDIRQKGLLSRGFELFTSCSESRRSTVESLPGLSTEGSGILARRDWIKPKGPCVVYVVVFRVYVCRALGLVLSLGVGNG